MGKTSSNNYSAENASTRDHQQHKLKEPRSSVDRFNALRKILPSNQGLKETSISSYS